MKYILITNTFKKNLKKLKKYFTKQDIIDDVKNFANKGLAKGETFLKSVPVYKKDMVIAKLRVSVRMVKARYLLAPHPAFRPLSLK